MVELRELDNDAVALLAHFTYLAIYVPVGVAAPPAAIVYEEPLLQAFFDNFGGRRGDLGLAAYEGDICTGAAWLRVIAGGYGHVDFEEIGDTPELAIAVEPEYRGLGIGTRLLIELFKLATAKGWRQVSLSVQKENRAYALYRRLGFKVFRDKGEDYLMLKQLRP
ncbi:MAG: GNAT family N-acetyltransferase [Coriobacteriales bacterium]|jgi:ribosomal protein S18 acetylase RimI-like enzyme|nr:GNAT family N-acetyltransferase [Coriobacteriales bacterium]